jgi:putative membrane protein
MHSHGGTPAVGTELVAAVVWLVFAAAYVGPALAHRTRRPWPFHRSLLWLAGLVCVYAGVRVAASLHPADFAGHTLGHLLVGMLGPLLLVAAAPMTLALRSLDAVPARRLSRVLRSRPVRFVTHPVPALVLNMGGLWLLFGTDLYSRMHDNAILAGLVHVHFLLSGYVLTAALVGTDPNPHRASFALRSVTLIAGLAAHNILAKYLYGHPPVGVSARDAEDGSVVMYYGGGAVEAVLIVLLCAQWYRASDPRRRARPGSVRPSGVSTSTTAPPASLATCESTESIT